MLIGIFDQMGAQTDRLRCEVCQNLILSPMNTGLLRPAVATVLTVYGIETYEEMLQTLLWLHTLQQYLPFTVLKLHARITQYCNGEMVATVLTVYGIETCQELLVLQHILLLQLQQYLPFTVLKPTLYPTDKYQNLPSLQQYLPFTVLKHD